MQLVCIQDIKFHKLIIVTSPVLVATYKDKTYQSKEWPETSYGDDVYLLNTLRTWVILKDNHMIINVSGTRIMLYPTIQPQPIINSINFSLSSEQKEQLVDTGKKAVLEFCDVISAESFLEYKKEAEKIIKVAKNELGLQEIFYKVLENENAELKKKQSVFDNDTCQKLNTLIKMDKSIVSKITTVINEEYNLVMNDVNDTIKKLELAYNSFLSLQQKVIFDDAMIDTMNTLKSKMDYYKQI
jgi:hypothetical protein